MVEDSISDNSALDAWRFSQAGDFLRTALDSLRDALETQFVVGPQLRAIRAEYIARHPDWDGTIKGATYEYTERTYTPQYAFWQASDMVRFASSSAILMAAIDIEAMVNYCFYRRFGKAFTESIERLILANRVEVAHKVLGKPAFSGSAPHQALTDLFNWRDKFAHGKNPDRPKRDLTSNHLTGERARTTLSQAVADCRANMKRYLLMMRHLRTLNGTLDDDVLYDPWIIDGKLAEVDVYRFAPDRGTKVIELPESV